MTNEETPKKSADVGKGVGSPIPATGFVLCARTDLNAYTDGSTSVHDDTILRPRPADAPAPVRRIGLLQPGRP